ncbi:MAG: hypothetical protein WDZ80_01955, partial [Candidatus Paceibacterota bacterium]
KTMNLKNKEIRRIQAINRAKKVNQVNQEIDKRFKEEVYISKAILEIMDMLPRTVGKLVSKICGIKISVKLNQRGLIKRATLTQSFPVKREVVLSDFNYKND